MFRIKEVVFLIFSCIVIFADETQRMQHKARPTLESKGPREIGYFWHLTDIFFDPAYTVLGAPENECHIKDTQNFSRNCGFFGEFGKCSAFGLVESLAKAMFQRNKQQSDFYLFTGNIRCPEATLAPYSICETIKAFLKDMQEAGPRIGMYSSYGWYDYYPYGHHPIKFTTFYGRMSEILRDQWETATSYQSSWLMGFFARVQLPKKRIRIIVLNTNFYMKNHIASELPDPAGQWAWLVGQLKGCRTTGQKAYIVMSIPPGVHSNPVGNHDLFWAQRHNRHYIRVIREYSDVVAAQFAGHHHTDTMRLVYSKQEEVIAAILLAPPIEPRFMNLPSMRMYMYDVNTGELLDYVQYYFNLTKANLEADMKNPEKYWEVGYSFRDYYGLPDVSLESLEKLVAGMQTNNITFQRYFGTTQSLRANRTLCENRCRMNTLCTMTNIDTSSFFECISGQDATIERQLEKRGDPPDAIRDYLLQTRSMPMVESVNVRSTVTTIGKFSLSSSWICMLLLFIN